MTGGHCKRLIVRWLNRLYGYRFQALNTAPFFFQISNCTFIFTTHFRSYNNQPDWTAPWTVPIMQAAKMCNTRCLLVLAKRMRSAVFGWNYPMIIIGRRLKTSWFDSKFPQCTQYRSNNINDSEITFRSLTWYRALLPPEVVHSRDNRGRLRSEAPGLHPPAVPSAASSVHGTSPDVTSIWTRYTRSTPLSPCEMKRKEIKLLETVYFI